MTSFEITNPYLFYSKVLHPRPKSRVQSSLPSRESKQKFSSNIEFKKSLDKNHLQPPTSPIERQFRMRSSPILHQPTPTPTPDVHSTMDDDRSLSSNFPLDDSKPNRFNLKFMKIPKKNQREQFHQNNSSKQNYDRRQIVNERKQRSISPDMNADDWFELRQSLIELKSLAENEQVLLDPTTSLFNCDGFCFEALQKNFYQQDIDRKTFSSQSHFRSGRSSYSTSISSPYPRSRASQSSPSNVSKQRPSTSKPATETYSRPKFEPLLVSAKPIHQIILSGNSTNSKKFSNRVKSTQSLTINRNHYRPLSSSSTNSNNNNEKFDNQQRNQMLLSDLSNPVEVENSSSTSPRLLKENDDQDQEIDDRTSSMMPQTTNYSRAPSSVSLRSTIKLKSQIPRCRSALESKLSSNLHKPMPKFIVITDQEHRIESWYHHYPFIQSDDFLQYFQTKKGKVTVLAYFLDDFPPLTYENPKPKLYLQGKPFSVNSDWENFDLIFVSKSIFQEVNVFLQVVLNRLRIPGKTIQVHQIDHQQDLKSQIRTICRQYHQKI